MIPRALLASLLFANPVWAQTPCWTATSPLKFGWTMPEGATADSYEGEVISGETVRTFTSHDRTEVVECEGAEMLKVRVRSVLNGRASDWSAYSFDVDCVQPAGRDADGNGTFTSGDLLGGIPAFARGCTPFKKASLP